MIRSERNVDVSPTTVWLRQLEICAGDSWHVDIDIVGHHTSKVASTFFVGIQADEWVFAFAWGPRMSRIRVAKMPVVLGRDDFALLLVVPPLPELGSLLAKLERGYEIEFDRRNCSINTTLGPDAAEAISGWVAGH